MGSMGFKKVRTNCLSRQREDGQEGRKWRTDLIKTYYITCMKFSTKNFKRIPTLKSDHKNTH